MATPPVTVKEVVSVSGAAARCPNPSRLRIIFRSPRGSRGSDVSSGQLTSPSPAPPPAHERGHQPAMHLVHQSHDGEREVHLRARDRRVQQRRHRGHGQPHAADEEVRAGVDRSDGPVAGAGDFPDPARREIRRPEPPIAVATPRGRDRRRGGAIRGRAPALVARRAARIAAKSARPPPGTTPDLAAFVCLVAFVLLDRRDDTFRAVSFGR